MLKVPIEEFFCRMAAMTVMNSTKCRDIMRSGGNVCGVCPGYERLKEAIATIEEKEAREVNEMREETARLATVYKSFYPDDQVPKSLMTTTEKGVTRILGQTRQKGGPDLFCRGCGRNNIPIRTRDDLCSRCSKRRRLGMPLDVGVEIRRGIRSNAKKG